MAGAGSVALGWILGKGSSPEDAGTAQTPQGMGTAPELQEFGQHCQGYPGIIGVSVQGQERDSILVGSLLTQCTL